MILVIAQILIRTQSRPNTQQTERTARFRPQSYGSAAMFVLLMSSHRAMNAKTQRLQAEAFVPV
jgi:hypothetical protein